MKQEDVKKWVEEQAETPRKQETGGNNRKPRATPIRRKIEMAIGRA